MKDFSLTKEELEQRLLDLDATKDGFQPAGLFAMCYSPARPRFEKVRLTCAGCGKRFAVEDVRDGVLDSYRRIANEYRDLGYDAQILFFCNGCVRAKSLPAYGDETTNVFFGFKAKGQNDYRLTPLSMSDYATDELRMVLEFLKGAKSYQELDKDYDFSSLFMSADGFRECIERILGLEIYHGPSATGSRD